MRKLFVPQTLIRGAALCAALVLPAIAAAEPMPPMAVWQSDYRNLEDIPGVGPITNFTLRHGGSLDGDRGTANGIQLPFGFSLLGSQPHTRFNVGSKGFIIFPIGNPSDDDASREGSTYLLSINPPRSLIAAWWGRNYCDPEAGVRSTVLGTAPNRRYIVEWKECGKRNSSSSTMDEDVKFQTQIWLYEGSNVIRVHYGDINEDKGAHWPYLAWGVKGAEGAGYLGPDRHGNRPVCDPGGPKGDLPNCASRHFPAQSVIQYGLGIGPDVTGRLETGDLTVTTDNVTMEVDLTLLNIGDAAVSGVNYELFLAEPRDRDPDQSGKTHPLYESSSGQTISAGGSVELTRTVTAPRPENGTYRVCMMLDPDNDLSAESDRTNNRVCAHENISVGPDLTVISVTAPASGRPSQTLSITSQIRNIGNDRAGAFEYKLVMRPSGADAGNFLPEEILFGVVEEGLDAGASMTHVMEVTLPELMRASEYEFELSLDPNTLLNEANRFNNIGVSTGKMTSHLPALEVITTPTPPRINLPDGCFYGEAIEATFQICNRGLAEAREFRPGIIMGDESQPGLTEDVTAASFPAYCGTPGTWNFTPCGQVGSLTGQCVNEYCRAECQNDAQCGPGLICADDEGLSDYLGRPAKGCMTRLEFGTVPQNRRCQTYTMRGRIPMHDATMDPRIYGDEYMYFHIIDDVLHSLSQPLPHIVTTDPVRCRPALLDLAVRDIRPGGRFVAGKDVAINRLIKNEGFINFEADGITRPEFETFNYRYYLGTTRDVSVNQIPLHVQGAPGGLAESTITRKGENRGTDIVTIPADIRPGQYYLALILDPAEELVELEKHNNTYVYPEPIQVEPKGLTIVNDLLPKANVGAEYSYTFVAISGLGPYTWSADNLPPGMTLTPNGILQGRPTEVGNFAFTLRVDSGPASNERVVALEVLPGQSELQVATTSLPIAVRGMQYGRWFDAISGTYQQGVKLAASGGQPPYTWELDPFSLDGRLPEGLEGPTPEGLISGQPTLMSQPTEFVVRVQDAAGNESFAELEIMVLDSGTLVIPSRSFHQAVSGAPYSNCIEAQGGEGNYHWTVNPDSIPQGLEMEAEGRSICLRGTPTTCGNFMVEMQVSDDQAQSSTAAISLSVECGVIQLSSHAVRPVNRGEVVEFQLGAVPSHEPTFRLHRGSLPSGLSLSEDGLISGTVASDASYRAHDMIIELSDAMGRRSLSALTMSVRIEPPPQEVVTTTRKTGCGSSTTGDPTAAFSTLGLALLGLGLLRRKNES